jgi:ABC-type antimicrobial peptide transport system permease subunit
VAADVRRNLVVEEPSMQYYVPFDQHPGLGAFTALFVRSTGDATALADMVATEMRGVEDGLPHPTVMTLEEMLGPSIRPWRMGIAMFSLFGLLALGVAAVGLYGVLAYTVAQRTRELGVRIALGAAVPDLLRLVVGQGVRVTAVGILIGAGGAYLAGRTVASMLYGVAPWDAAVLVAAATVLLGVAVAASYLPARRAAKVDPVEALRYE